MAKKKAKQVDAQVKAIETLVNNVPISQDTKAALLERLREDLTDAEVDLLELQPDYEEYLKREQKVKLTKRMIAEIEGLQVTNPTPPVEPVQEEKVDERKL